MAPAAKSKEAHSATDFASLGLRSFLDLDDRPTIVFERRLSGPANELYENPAFSRLHNREKSGHLKEWILCQLVQGHQQADRRLAHDRLQRQWSRIVLKERWYIVSCTDGNPTSSAATSTPSNGESQTTVVRTQSAASLLGWDHFSTKPSAHEQMVLDHPWHETPLGSIETWSTVLRQAVTTTLKSLQPTVLMWGPDAIFVYNESIAPMLAQKHPTAIGKPCGEVFIEVWESIAEPVHAAMFDGKASLMPRSAYFINRRGFEEQVFCDINFIPVVGSSENERGLFDITYECTETVMSERRQKIADSVEDISNHAQTTSDLWPLFTRTLLEHVEDVPFALVFVRDEQPLADSVEGESAASNSFVCAESVGVSADALHLPSRLRMSSDAPEEHDPLRRAIHQAILTLDITTLAIENGTLPAHLQITVPGRGFGDKIRSICVLPICLGRDSQPLSFIVLSMNPRRPFDDHQQTFATTMRDRLLAAVTITQLPEDLRRQREADDLLKAILAEQLRLKSEESKLLETRFLKMAEASPVGMYIFNPQMCPEFTNDAFLRMLGMTRKRCMELAVQKGPYWSADFAIDEDRSMVMEALEAVLVRRESVSIRCRFKASVESGLPNLSTFYIGTQHVWANFVPELAQDGSLRALHGWLADMSHEVLKEEHMTRRLQEAQEAKRKTETFIDMTSHEMRNPLSAILQSADGILSLLDSHRVATTDEAIADAAHTIVLCAQHQKRIVDDILTLSKLDADLLMISPDRTNPVDLLRKCIKMYEAELNRLDINVAMEIKAGVAALDVSNVMMDASRVLQIIINLLTNAIKFTQDQGQRSITLSLDATLERPIDNAGMNYIPCKPGRLQIVHTPELGDGQEIFLHFTVKDTGKGLTADELKFLFQRFSQASPKTYKQYGGSGLGLFISRELCELQGGQIGVCSRPGHGSTFNFYVRARKWTSGSLPLKKLNLDDIPEASIERVDRIATTSLPAPLARTKTEPLPDTASTEPLIILVVEDNIINQKVMATQIRSQGHVVHVANHGEEALDFIKSTRFWTTSAEGAGKSLPLSVVLMDQEMPVMDGLTCVRIIREFQTAGSITGHIPIIAVTANARSEQVSNALAAGMDEVVTKPFRVPQVLELAERLIERLGDRQ